jgi:SAM-dependent methyltransferase
MKMLLIILGTIGLLGLGKLALQPIIRRALRPRRGAALGVRDRVLKCFEKHRMYVFMFAYFKTRADPMFDELPELLAPAGEVRTILDLGCGFGFAGAFLLDQFPAATLYGIDPSANRVVEAARAWGARGQAFQGAAPDFERPALPAKVDLAVFLDVIHFLDDSALELTFQRIRARLNPGQYFVMRVSVPPQGRGSWMWRSYKLHRTIRRLRHYFRPADEVRRFLTSAGFDVQLVGASGEQRHEMYWFISTAAQEG